MAAGTLEDAMRLTLFVTSRSAVGEIVFFIFIDDERFTLYLTFCNQSVWEIKRLNVAAVFRCQNFAGTCN